MYGFAREYRVPPTITAERQKEIEEKARKEQPLLTNLFPPPMSDGVYEYDEVRIVECTGAKWYQPGLLHMATKEEWKDGVRTVHTKCSRKLQYTKRYRVLRARTLVNMMWRASQTLRARRAKRVPMCSQCIARARKEKNAKISG